MFRELPGFPPSIFNPQLVESKDSKLHKFKGSPVLYEHILHEIMTPIALLRAGPGHMSKCVLNERMNDYILQDNITPICLSPFRLL